MEFQCSELLPNHAINADSGKRRAFVAPIFTAGYGERWAVLMWCAWFC